MIFDLFRPPDRYRTDTMHGDLQLIVALACSGVLAGCALGAVVRG